MSFLHLFTHFDKKTNKKHRNEIKHKQRNFIFFEFCEYYFAGLHLGIPESWNRKIFLKKSRNLHIIEFFDWMNNCYLISKKVGQCNPIKWLIRRSCFCANCVKSQFFVLKVFGLRSKPLMASEVRLRSRPQKTSFSGLDVWTFLTARSEASRS